MYHNYILTLNRFEVYKKKHRFLKNKYFHFGMYHNSEFLNKSHSATFHNYILTLNRFEVYKKKHRFLKNKYFQNSNPKENCMIAQKNCM
jgi:hypothetical protein